MDQCQTQANGNRCEPGRRPLVRGTQNDENEHHSHHDLGNQCGLQCVTTGRVSAVAILSKTAGNVKAGLASGDKVKDPSRHDAAKHLRQDVGN